MSCAALWFGFAALFAGGRGGGENIDGVWPAPAAEGTDPVPMAAAEGTYPLLLLIVPAEVPIAAADGV